MRREGRKTCYGHWHSPRLCGSVALMRFVIMDRILLGHGSGGKLMHELIREHFSPAFGIQGAGDSAIVNVPTQSARLYHRFLRGYAALLSRRQYRGPGCQRHGERSGCRRRQTAISDRGLHHRRRIPPLRSQEDHCVHVCGSPKGRCHDRCRRHQGREQGKGRRHLHQYLGHRVVPAGREISASRIKKATASLSAAR